MRAKNVYYHESSGEDENEIANLTDSDGNNDRGESDGEQEYVQAGYIEEDEIEKILTWRTEKAANNADQCKHLISLI